MKNYLIVICMMLAVSQAYGFKKDKKDPKDAKIDSLSEQCDTLHMKLDSVSKEFTKYYVVYTVIKEKILKYDFDPARTSMLIDSLRERRDASMSGINGVLRDSIAAVKTENLKLKAIVSSITTEEAANNRVISELKQLKDLLDSKILTQAEFDTKKANVLHKWQ